MMSSLKRKRGLRKVSKKREAENTTYRLHVLEWRADRIREDGFWRCQFKGSPQGAFFQYDTDDNRCQNEATDVHHKMSRGKYLTYKRYFMGCCRFHHSWIEANKREARKRGYILYK